MPPLTPPSGCGGCLRISQKISELEGRISMLYQIRYDEQILDSLVTFGPAAASTTACELDSTVPWIDVAGRADHWSQLGAKPKDPVSSTLSQKEPWTDVRRRTHHGTHRGKLICRPTPPRALQLTNGFSILDEEDFPPLAAHRTQPTAPRSGVPLLLPSPPPLCTAASRSSVLHADHSSRRNTTFSLPLPSPPPLCTAASRTSVIHADHSSGRHTTFSRPGSAQFTPRPAATDARVQTSERVGARSNRHTPPLHDPAANPSVPVRHHLTLHGPRGRLLPHWS
ncbi:hypothetical protein NQZ68_019996 [Dissostichus eleginoides]|nr:hypothetical protein NQZ68_019996 [Dissostichus eleginoides]